MFVCSAGVQACALPILQLCENFFFFNDTAPPEIYTLSLHDALPISAVAISLLRLSVGLGKDAGAGSGLASGTGSDRGSATAGSTSGSDTGSAVLRAGAALGASAAVRRTCWVPSAAICTSLNARR